MNKSNDNNIIRIKELTAPIFKKYGVEKAYIFGSYASGDYNENSDTDTIEDDDLGKAPLVVVEKSTFSGDLNSEEINILAVYMIV